MFDPEVDGVGAIKGGRSRCLDLHAIFEKHQRILALTELVPKDY
jgi:hypothetical protein